MSPPGESPQVDHGQAPGEVRRNGVWCFGLFTASGFGVSSSVVLGWPSATLDRGQVGPRRELGRRNVRRVLNHVVAGHAHVEAEVRVRSGLALDEVVQLIDLLLDIRRESRLAGLRAPRTCHPIAWGGHVAFHLRCWEIDVTGIRAIEHPWNEKWAAARRLTFQRSSALKTVSGCFWGKPRMRVIFSLQGAYM